MANLYSPPTWNNVSVLRGSLRVKQPTCYLVYRQGGVWNSVQSPGMGTPDVTQVDTDAASGLKLFFYTPTIIPNSLVAQLTAFGQGTITTV